MKTSKKIALISFISICFLFLFLFLRESRPFSTLSLQGKVLINKLPKDSPFELQLFYSTIDQSTIESFIISPQGNKKLNTPYLGYTEGFLPQDKMQGFLKQVSAFRQTQGLPAIGSFHDYYEDDTHIIISVTGGLESIYIINKSDEKIMTPSYETSQNLGPMYVSHIRKIEDRYYILGGAVNAYNAYIYELSATSFKVLGGTSLATHPSAINEHHYTLDGKGNALFIHDQALLILPAKETLPTLLPLPFKADALFSGDVYTAALSFEEERLHYALLSPEFTLSKANTDFSTGTLDLPHQNTQLVDAFVQNTLLYLITFDSTHPLYRNYISIYDLETGDLLYCLALEGRMDAALLDALLHPLPQK